MLAGGDAFDSLERLGERELVVVADFMGDVGDQVALFQQVGGEGHAPSRDVRQRGFADRLAESSREGGA